jgi:hypothetical protein
MIRLAILLMGVETMRRQWRPLAILGCLWFALETALEELLVTDKVWRRLLPIRISGSQRSLREWAEAMMEPFPLLCPRPAPGGASITHALAEKIAERAPRASPRADRGGDGRFSHVIS